MGLASQDESKPGVDHPISTCGKSPGGSAIARGEPAGGGEVGVQDGSPCSGLLSLHARVEGVAAETWRDPRLAQVFGPRGVISLVPRADVGVFTLGLIPTDEREAEKIRAHAEAIRSVLGGKTMSQRAVLEQVPGGPRLLRWAAATGSLPAIWDTVDTRVVPVPAPSIDPGAARRELARRFFRYHGPASVDDLRWWLETPKRAAVDLVAEIREELVEVPLEGETLLVPVESMALIDEAPAPPPVLLRPPDDVHVNRRTARRYADPKIAAALWPKAPPPGALLAYGEVVGTWRRRGKGVTVTCPRPFTAEQILLATEQVKRFPLPVDDEPSVTFVEA